MRTPELCFKVCTECTGGSEDGSVSDIRVGARHCSHDIGVHNLHTVIHYTRFAYGSTVYIRCIYGIIPYTELSNTVLANPT